MATRKKTPIKKASKKEPVTLTLTTPSGKKATVELTKHQLEFLSEVAYDYDQDLPLTEMLAKAGAIKPRKWWAVLGTHIEAASFQEAEEKLMQLYPNLEVDDIYED